MTDSQQLLLVMIAIYASECAGWCGLHAVIVTSAGRRFRWAQPGGLFGNAASGLFFKPPFPPLGECFLTQPWTVSVSPHGVLSTVAQCFNRQFRPDSPVVFVSFEELESFQRIDAELRANGRPFCHVATKEVARQIVATVKACRESTASEREEIIREQQRTRFDTDAIAQRLDEFRRACLALRVAENALWCLAFVIGPLVVWRYDWVLTWRYLLVVLVVCVLLVAMRFRSAHQRLHPDERFERRLYTALAVLNPLGAMRSHDIIARELLAGFHPLAVVWVLCEKAAFEDFARRLLLDLRHPLGSDDAPVSEQAAGTESWFRELQFDLCWEFVNRPEVGANDGAAVDVEELLAIEPPVDDLARSYCPRCRCQFVMASGACHACGGIRLQPLPSQNHDGN